MTRRSRRNALVALAFVGFLVVVSLPFLMEPGDRGAFSGDDCSTGQLNWMEVEEKYDQSAIVSIAGRLAASAKSDADKVADLSRGQGKAEFSSNLTQPSEYSSSRKARVSQEFFQAAFSYRQAVCTLERQIQQRVFEGNPSALESAQKQLIDLSAAFGRFSSTQGSEARQVDYERTADLSGVRCLPGGRRNDVVVLTDMVTFVVGEVPPQFRRPYQVTAGATLMVQDLVDGGAPYRVDRGIRSGAEDRGEAVFVVDAKAKQARFRWIWTNAHGSSNEGIGFSSVEPYVFRNVDVTYVPEEIALENRTISDDMPNLDVRDKCVPSSPW